MKLRKKQKVSKNLFHIDALSKGLPQGISFARCGEFFRMSDRNPKDKSCPVCFGKSMTSKYVWDDTPELPKQIKEVMFETPTEPQ